MAFMMLLLVGWVIWNNKPLTIDHWPNFAKTLVWKHENDVKLWRHKDRTPNTNDHHMTLNEPPQWRFSAYAIGFIKASPPVLTQKGWYWFVTNKTITKFSKPKQIYWSMATANTSNIEVVHRHFSSDKCVDQGRATFFGLRAEIG